MCSLEELAAVCGTICICAPCPFNWRRFHFIRIHFVPFDFIASPLPFAFQLAGCRTRRPEHCTDKFLNCKAALSNAFSFRPQNANRKIESGKKSRGLQHCDWWSTFEYPTLARPKGRLYFSFTQFTQLSLKDTVFDKQIFCLKKILQMVLGKWRTHGQADRYNIILLICLENVVFLF